MSFRPLTRGVRRVLIVWGALCAFVWITIPIGAILQRWECEDDAGGGDPRADEVVTCADIREDSVFEVIAYATAFIGLTWLVVTGVILGTWKLIALARR